MDLHELLLFKFELLKACLSFLHLFLLAWTDWLDKSRLLLDVQCFGDGRYRSVSRRGYLVARWHGWTRLTLLNVHLPLDRSQFGQRSVML